MIPPSAPIVREVTAESWKLISHADFDGELLDTFSNTSLHLNFTEYQLALETGIVGSRDVAAYFLESVVSLHDRGVWVADLDILKTLAVESRTDTEENTGGAIDAQVVHRNLHKIRCICNAVGNTASQNTAAKDAVLAAGLTSIDTWEELLDPPESVGLVRAVGNWQARLAATALGVALGHDTVIVGSELCWTCIEKVLDQLERDPAEKTPIIIV